MTRLLYDRFQDADATLLQNHRQDYGGAWSKIFGPANLAIQSNQLQRAGTALFAVIYLNNGLPGEHYEASFTLVQQIPGGFDGLQVCFYAMRQAGTFDGYLIGIGDTDEFTIAKISGGVTSKIVTLSEVLILPLTLTAQVRLSDGLLRLFANGVEKLQLNDQQFSGGQSGLYWQGDTSGSAGIIIDDFSAHDARSGIVPEREIAPHRL